MEVPTSDAAGEVRASEAAGQVEVKESGAFSGCLSSSGSDRRGGCYRGEDLTEEHDDPGIRLWVVMSEIGQKTPLINQANNSINPAKNTYQEGF